MTRREAWSIVLSPVWLLAVLPVLLLVALTTKNGLKTAAGFVGVCLLVVAIVAAATLPGAIGLVK